MGALPIETATRQPVTTGERPLVLCLDDDTTVLALCRAALTRAGFQVDTVANGWDALKQLNVRAYAVVVIDLLMPSLHGRTVLSLIQQSHPELLPRIIVMTGLSDNALDDLYGKVGGILRKPLQIESLVDFVREFAAVQRAAGRAG